ncbi:CHAT domain-containing protein [Actinosynnema sp. NPDC050436]|uniref:CHAT domain-containing protein n=1 Tax=Actinosynnema sp. NPDC050436 TaxID=3155659 RepID=UPI0033F4FD49
MFADRLASARQALAEGNHDQAVLIVGSGLAEARRRCDRGDGDALAWTVVLTTEFDALTEDVLEPAERTRPWEELRALARRAGAAPAELGSVLRLAVLHLRADRPEVAAEHAAAVLDLVPRNGVLRADGVEIEGPDPTTIHEVLADVAHDLYYRREDFDAVEALAGAFAGHFPDSPIPWYFLGHSAARLEHHDDAVRALTRLAELVPDAPGPLVALSGSLFHVDRRQEAVAALDQAIALAPDEARYRYFRARVHAADGRAEEALADLDDVIGVPVPRPRGGRPDPARELVDLAAVLRLNLLVDLGRTGEAGAEARVLADTADEPTAGAAYAVLGELAFDAGDHRRAIVCFTAQLDLHESAEALLSRAATYEAADLLDAAAADLDAVTAHDPDLAVEVLSGLRERHPTHAGTAKALGHALLRALDPARAVEELAAAHRRLPDDWQVVAWLGLAAITHSAAGDDWNAGFGSRRVLDAVARLTDAVLLAPDEPYPRRHLRWLVDRACAWPPVLEFLLAARDVPRGFGPGGADLAAALPDVDDLLTRWSRVVPGEPAPADLAALRSGVRDLPVLGALLDLRTADAHLRRCQVSEALGLVAEAERALLDVGRPPLADLLPDLDHRELVAVVHAELRKAVAARGSRALHRLGDLEGALEAADHGLGDDDFDDLYQRAVLLRDVGRVDEAVGRLPRLAELATDADRTRLANLEATLHLSRRDFDAAADVLERVLPTVAPDSYDASVFVGNLISVHLERDEPARVLDLVDRYPLPACAQPSLLLDRYAMRAVALCGLGDHRGAADGFRAALEIAEDVRAGLPDRESRSSWQATHLWVYEQAVLASLADGDLVGALELVGRAKAHAFPERPGHRAAAVSAQRLDVAVAVRGGCVLAEFYVAADRVLLFVLTPGSARPVVYQWAADPDELVGWFFDRSARELDPDAFAEAFGPLVAPITDHCAPGDVVLLVPHGELHHLPLHALLLDRNPVCRLPSSGLGHGRPGRREWRTALVLGDPGGDCAHARREAEAVAEVFGTRPALGGEATRDRLSDADVIHLACRARFDDDPAVLLADGHELTVQDVLGLEIGAGLVTLAACESGAGEELAHAVLHAGVPSVVMSLWEVDDLSTSLLMADFYARARSGAGLAVALRDAQSALAATTAREVVAHCDERLAGADPVTAAALLLDRAGAQAAAGDVVGAAASCREVDPVLAGTRGPSAGRLRARAARRLTLLALKAESAPPVDYATRPFAHPYHWAAFVLVGDWR